MKERIALIDADHALYICCYNKKDSLIEKSLEDVYNALDEYITHLIELVNPSKYLLLLSPKKTFRNDIADTYKAQRKPSTINYLREGKQYLIDKWGAKLHENLEADDCCLILEKLLKDKYEVVIVSPDKDIHNTEGYRFIPRDKVIKYTTREEDLEFFWTSMIKGDGVDGVKSIPGRGEAYAKKLFASNYIDKKTHAQQVLQAYIDHFGEYVGIEEFYKNYRLLKILQDYEGFEFNEQNLIDIGSKESI